MSVTDIKTAQRARSREAVRKAHELEYGQDFHIDQRDVNQIADYLDKDFKRMFEQERVAARDGGKLERDDE